MGGNTGRRHSILLVTCTLTTTNGRQAEGMAGYTTGHSINTSSSSSIYISWPLDRDCVRCCLWGSNGSTMIVSVPLISARQKGQPWPSESWKRGEVLKNKSAAKKYMYKLIIFKIMIIIFFPLLYHTTLSLLIVFHKNKSNSSIHI